MKKHLNTMPLYHKIMLLLLSMLLLLGTMLGVLLWDSLTDMTDQLLIRQGTDLGNHIASLSADHILTDNRYFLYELIQEVHTNNADVRYILVTDAQQRILAHTFGHDLPQGLAGLNLPERDGSPSIVTYQTNEGSMRDILLPIEGGSVGYVRIGMQEERLRSQMQHRLRNLIAATFLVCVIAALLTAKLAVNITRPLTHLSEITREIGKGNLHVRATAVNDDEIGKLAAAFNAMTDNLIQSNDERDRLLHQLAEKEHLRKTLLNKLLTVQEEERKRISRELHDQTGQALTSLLVSMRILAGNIHNPQQRQILTGAREIAAVTLQDIRNLAVELRPPAIDDLGLAAACRKYVNTFQNLHGLPVHFTASQVHSKVDSHTAVALYRILQESLTNIAKHANAAHVFVMLEIQENHVALAILDDGCGFDAAIVREDRLGIHGMRERAELLGGTLTVVSHSGRGTKISVVVPNLKEGPYEQT